jgi:hypothetical protein
MLLKDFLPASALRDYVQWYRIVHFEFDGSAKIPFKMYPHKPGHVLHFFVKGSFAIEEGDDGKVYQPPGSRICNWMRKTSFQKRFGSFLKNYSTPIVIWKCCYNTIHEGVQYKEQISRSGLAADRRRMRLF